MMRLLKLGILEGKLGPLVAKVDYLIKLHTFKAPLCHKRGVAVAFFPGCCINFCLWMVKSHENKCDCFKCAIQR